LDTFFIDWLSVHLLPFTIYDQLNTAYNIFFPMILMSRKDRDFRTVWLAGGGAKTGACPYDMFDPYGGLGYGDEVAVLVGSMYGEGGWAGGGAES